MRSLLHWRRRSAAENEKRTATRPATIVSSARSYESIATCTDNVRTANLLGIDHHSLNKKKKEEEKKNNSRGGLHTVPAGTRRVDIGDFGAAFDVAVVVDAAVAAVDADDVVDGGVGGLLRRPVEIRVNYVR